jgi:UrcA family protein
MKTLSAALALMGLMAVPAMASVDRPRENVSISVSAADLDLNNANDLERLRSRMQRTVSEACNPSDRVNPYNNTDWQCRRELKSNINSTVLKIARQNNGPTATVASN